MAVIHRFRLKFLSKIAIIVNVCFGLLGISSPAWARNLHQASLAERYRMHINSIIDALEDGTIESDMRYLSGLKEIDAAPVVDANKRQNPQQAKKKRIEGGKADGGVAPRGPQQAKKIKPGGGSTHPRGPQQAKKK